MVGGRSRISAIASKVLGVNAVVVEGLVSCVLRHISVRPMRMLLAVALWAVRSVVWVIPMVAWRMMVAFWVMMVLRLVIAWRVVVRWRRAVSLYICK